MCLKVARCAQCLTVGSRSLCRRCSCHLCFLYWALYGCCLPYFSVTSRHGQLLANEICVHDHNEEGSVNYQGNPSGTELLSTYGFSRLGLCMCSFRNTLPGGPFWWRVTRCLFLYCLNFNCGELPGLLFCNQAPADAVLKWRFPVFQAWGLCMINLHAQDAVKNFSDWKARNSLSCVSHCHVICSHDLVLLLEIS